MYIFAKISVCYKPYCVYIFAKKKAFEARLRDGRPKFRNAAKKAKQNKATEERLRGATFVRSSAKKANPLPEEKKAKELQWSFANCLRRSAVKISVGKFL